MSAWIIAEADIWVRALSRLQPDPGIVHRLGEAIRARRLLVPGMVRLVVLSLTRDQRQFARLGGIFAGFPELPVLERDYDEAARLMQRHRREGLGERPALLWAIATRCHASLWTDDRVTVSLSRIGLPLLPTN